LEQSKLSLISYYVIETYYKATMLEGPRK